MHFYALFEPITTQFSAYYKLLMLDNDEEEEEDSFKNRLRSLKSYISNIKQQIGFYQPLHTSAQTKRKQVLLESPPIQHITISVNPEPSKLEKEKERLLSQIQAKQKKIGLNKFNKNEGIKNLQHHLSFAQVFVSNTKIYQKLEKINTILANSDWEPCKLFKNNNDLALVGYRCLYVDNLSFRNIKLQSLQIYNEFLMLNTFGNKERYYVFKFMNKQIAIRWLMLLKNLITSFQFKLLPQKWSTTSIKPKPLQMNSNDQKIRFLQTNAFIKKIPVLEPQSPPKNQDQKSISDILLLSPLNVAKKKPLAKKETISNSSFFLSNSSDKNEQEKTFEINISKSEIIQNLKSGLVQSKFNKNKKQEIKKMTNENKQEIQYEKLLKISKQDSILMTSKLIQKLTEKKKLLSDSSATKLGIHWHQNTEENEPQHQALNIPEIQYPQRFIPSPKIVRNKVSVSTTKQNQSSTRRDSHQSPSKIKRVQSAVNRQKSNSRESQSIMEFQSGLRKKTQFSLQMQHGTSPTRRKTTKQQIQDSYLQKLLNKQGIIRQISKSTSKNSSQKHQDALMLPSAKKLSQHQPSKYSSDKLAQGSNVEDSQSQEKDSADNEVQIQQLKNGIVLEKCSKNSWSTKQKKLYLSNTMTQLCYCDVNNLHEQKKYLIRDIVSVEYGRVTRGILKHKKKKCDEGRCLVVRIDNDGKEKLLEFYLEDSEPVHNLSQFANKLQNFVETVNRNQTYEEIQED